MQVCCLSTRLVVVDVLFVFFSSRRRHTSYWRDWISDVSSSDLIDNQNRQAVFRQRAGGDVLDLAQPRVERLDDQLAFTKKAIHHQAVDIVIASHHDDGDVSR